MAPQTPNRWEIPASHGCIRMRNPEIFELFDLDTSEDALVYISEQALDLGRLNVSKSEQKLDFKIM